MQPGTGICVTGSDPDVVDGKSCSGNLDDGGDSGEGSFDGSESLFQLGKAGFHDCAGGMTGGTCKVESYASLSASGLVFSRRLMCLVAI